MIRNCSEEKCRFKQGTATRLDRLCWESHAIQFCRKAMVTLSVCLLVKGMALHQIVKRITQVKRKRCLRDMHMMEALIGGITSTNRCVIGARLLGSRARNAAPRQVVNFLLHAILGRVENKTDRGSRISHSVRTSRESECLP